jgi:uncharacterized protein (TIGR02217 family)
MAFQERQFPPTISFGAIGGPGFSTDVVTVSSGAEQRNRKWSEMRHGYEVSQAIKKKSDFAAVRAFFLSVGGRADGFRFKDWADFECSITEGVVVGLTSTTFQLYKRYASGAVSVDRKITKPIAGGLVVTNSGAALTLTTDYTLDTTTGVLTTTTPKTAANLRWDGEFDVPARFDVDELRSVVVDRNGRDGELLLSWASIPIVEIPVA